MKRGRIQMRAVLLLILIGLSLSACAAGPGEYVYGGYPAYPYYPYPLPPAPSLGFGRGGIYGHAFVGRDEGITSFTLPGSR